MAVGFRKSLFGFNCDDVINYIKKSHDSFAKKEKELGQRADELTACINELNQKLQKITCEKETLQKTVEEYDKKYEDIERLSENIGKLYLVAQTNAQAIMKNAEENSRITMEEIVKNMSAMDSAHESLQELRNKINQTSESFISEVDALMDSLGNAKDKFSSDINADSLSKQNFEEIYEAISNERV